MESLNFVAVLFLVLQVCNPAELSQSLKIDLDKEGTSPYVDAPVAVTFGDSVMLNCTGLEYVSVFNVHRTDYENCSFPKLVKDGGTSIHIGDCPKLLQIIIATGAVQTSVSYAAGEIFYYAAYEVDSAYKVKSSNSCEEGVKFKLVVEEATVASESQGTPTVGSIAASTSGENTQTPHTYISYMESTTNQSSPVVISDDEESNNEGLSNSSIAMDMPLLLPGLFCLISTLVLTYMI